MSYLGKQEGFCGTPPLNALTLGAFFVSMCGFSDTIRMLYFIDSIFSLSIPKTISYEGLRI
jgi:hypothetical protein